MPKAMILAAGLGKRLWPITDRLPKALVPLAGKPLIGHVITKLEQFNYTDIIVNLHHHGDQLKNYLAQHTSEKMSFSFSDESGLLLDTGGGLAKAAWFFNEGGPFLVHNCDVISLIALDEMLQFHISNQAIATIAVSERKTSRPLAFDGSGQLAGRWPATPEPGSYPLAFSGISILSPSIFAYKPSAEVFSLIDMLINAAGSEKVLAFNHDPNIWVDAGTANNFPMAEQLLKNAHL